MKIVFLSYLHGFGGAERQNIMLANAMVERGHEVYMISISADNKTYDLDTRIKYIFIPDRFKNKLNIFGRYCDLRHVLKEISPDISVSFWFQSSYLSAMMPSAYTGKIIYSERGDPGDKEYSGALGLVRKLILPRINGFVFQSRGAQSYFDEKVQKRSCVISNPVFLSASDYPAVKDRKKNVVAIGRLHPQKNFKLLIQAFAKIADRFPEYKMEIFGDGPLKEDLSALISSLNMDGRICLMGTDKNIHARIYDAGLFVLSSDYEGLPNALIEAMALGIPSISTDCRPGGARDLITQNVDGIIAPLGDIDSLSKAMEWSLTHYDESCEMGARAAKKMQNYSPDKIYSKWEQFFEEMYKE